MDTILVVDDEWSIREITTLMLEKSGYRVVTATNASEGLEIFASQDLAAVILDVVLPGKNGLELALEINQLKPGTPIVLMSGRISPESDSIKNFTGHFGITCALPKPFTHTQLVDALRAAINQGCA